MLWLILRLGFQPTDYFRLLKRFSFSQLRVIVFDHMLPRISCYYRREEAEALLRDAGLVDGSSAWVNQMSWSVVGTKANTLK